MKYRQDWAMVDLKQGKWCAGWSTLRQGSQLLPTHGPKSHGTCRLALQPKCQGTRLADATPKIPRHIAPVFMDFLRFRVAEVEDGRGIGLERGIRRICLFNEEEG